ncbi:hypothetical protein Taro_039388, partial [Colocasia esculenta]|nr:hypothetical protein [Colocasia esculenta]
ALGAGAARRRPAQVAAPPPLAQPIKGVGLGFSWPFLGAVKFVFGAIRRAFAAVSRAELLVSGEDITVEAEAIADVVCPADEKGWRSTRNRAGKAPQLPTQESSVVLTECPESSDILFELDTDIRKHRGSQRLRKGKRKSNSGHIYSGECSTSAFDISEVQSLQLSGEPARSNSAGTSSSHINGLAFGPIIDVDHLPSPLLRSTHPENGCCTVSEDSVARARQVDSDEILARQLQEQFFNESPTFGGEDEIDASIAWTLQQEENTQRVSSLRSHGQPNSRRIRQYPRQSSRSSVVQSTGRSRIYSSARMARIWRNMRQEMDLETVCKMLSLCSIGH